MLSSTETINYKQLVETINKAIFGDSSRETTREDTGVNTINEEKTTSSIDNSVKSSEQFIRENYQKRYLHIKEFQNDSGTSLDLQSSTSHHPAQNPSYP